MHICCTDVQCYPDGAVKPVPLLSSSKNQTTVEGEMVTFKCSFGDNYSPVDYSIFWRLTLENGSHILVQDGLNYTDYHVNTYQDCPSTNYSCCRFTTELSINGTSLSMNNSVINCNAMINQVTSSGISHLSELMYSDVYGAL